MAGSLGLGEIVSAGGVLGELFGGGGSVKNPYDANITDSLNGESGAGNAAAGAGETALQQYSQFSPEANAATQSELDYLNTNPYTDTYSQAKLSDATGHAMQGFTQSKAALANDLGARGMAAGGGSSSLLAGGDAGIDAQEGATLAQGQNSIAMQAIQQRAQNLAMANQVAAQHAGALWGQGMQGTSAGGGLLGNVASGYDTLGVGEMQATQNANNADQSAWGALSSLGGTILSGALGKDPSVNK